MLYWDDEQTTFWVSDGMTAEDLWQKTGKPAGGSVAIQKDVYKRQALQRAGLIDSAGNSVPQLIKIKKNSDGKISAVNTETEGTDFEPGFGSKDTKMTFFRPTGAGYSFFFFMMDEDTMIFQVPKNTENARDKDYKMCEVCLLYTSTDFAYLIQN